MHRTTIMLPNVLKGLVEAEAERTQVSFGELVRQILQKYILSKKSSVARDAFLSSTTSFTDDGATNVAAEHDRYLVRDPH